MLMNHIFFLSEEWNNQNIDAEYILVMKCFQVEYHGISHKSLYFLSIHKGLYASVQKGSAYQEN